MISGTSSYRYLLDTNIIVYPHDVTDILRQRRASELLVILKSTQNAALPAQVLSEFASVALRKFRPAMDWSEIYLQIQE